MVWLAYVPTAHTASLRGYLPLANTPLGRRYRFTDTRRFFSMLKCKFLMAMVIIILKGDKILYDESFVV